MPKVKKTFRLEQETVNKLVKLSEDEGKTVTEILERAIQAYGKEPDGSHTDSHTVDVLSEELRQLHKQLDIKDEQIHALNEALTSSHDALKASQVLQAANLPQLEESNNGNKKSLLKRISQALKG